MAVDYTDWFTKTGSLVSEINRFVDQQAEFLLGVGVGWDDIWQHYITLEDQGAITGLRTTYDGFVNQYGGMASTLQTFVLNTIGLLQNDLLGSSASAGVMLPLISRDMISQSETVLENNVSVGSTTPSPLNAGTGTLVLDVVDDTGQDDQRIIDQPMVWRCRSDRFTGSAAGKESFNVVGLPPPSLYNGVIPRGSGTQSMNVGKDALSNGSLNSWSNLAPIGWTVDDGIAGTHIVEETTDVWAFDSAMAYVSDAIQATISISQLIQRKVSARTRQCAGIWMKRPATITAGSTIEVVIQGTGLVDEVVLKFDPSTNLNPVYTLYFVFFTVPADIPDDYAIHIRWTTANVALAGETILSSGVQLAAADVVNRLRAMIFRGDRDFIKGDEIDVVAVNDYAGIFQTFFGRYYDFVLPSSATPTIPDSLVQ